MSPKTRPHKEGLPNSLSKKVGNVSADLTLSNTSNSCHQRATWPTEKKAGPLTVSKFVYMYQERHNDNESEDERLQGGMSPLTHRPRYVESV